MSKPSFKTYLKEYYRYFRSLDDVLDNEDGEPTKIDGPTAARRKAQEKEQDCEEIERGDGEQDYDPCKFRQYMEISVAGD